MCHSCKLEAYCNQNGEAVRIVTNVTGVKGTLIRTTQGPVVVVLLKTMVFAWCEVIRGCTEVSVPQ